jgi:hypothetical protein
MKESLHSIYHKLPKPITEGIGGVDPEISRGGQNNNQVVESGGGGGGGKRS